MGALQFGRGERPRELRRRVVLPARLRSGAEWSDACILNVSSRGLMIQSGRGGLEGSQVELRRGNTVIVATIMWRKGTRAGLCSDEQIPIDEILSANQSKSLQLAASDGALIDRRARRRPTADDARLRGRLVEYAGVAAIGILLAIGAWTMVDRALAKPFLAVDRVLSGQS